MQKTFWSRIEDRTSGVFTRKMLASAAGIAVNTISMWKARNSYPSADVAVKVAQALGTTVEFLVTGIEPPKPDFLVMEGKTEYAYTEEAPLVKIFLTMEEKQVLEDLKELDSNIKTGFISAIHQTAECARREKKAAVKTG